jgi:Ca-activated chloride channel family protein
LLEKISGKGNGNYAYIDSKKEAHKVLVEQMSGTLVTIAKDVKIQVDFDKDAVKQWRLIGYVNRVMAAQDFANDKKDAGEIGAGHTVTALYELVPQQNSVSNNSSSRFQEMMRVKLRYKKPLGTKSKLISFDVSSAPTQWRQASNNLRWASTVAQFGMMLRNSPYKNDATYEGILSEAQAAKGDDNFGYRNEFLGLIQIAKNLKRNEIGMHQVRY